MARRRTKRTKRTRRKSTISKLERSLRKTIERSIRKSLKKLTNRKTKKNKRKTKRRKKKLQRGGTVTAGEETEYRKTLSIDKLVLTEREIMSRLRKAGQGIHEPNGDQHGRSEVYLRTLARVIKARAAREAGGVAPSVAAAGVAEEAEAAAHRSQGFEQAKMTHRLRREKQKQQKQQKQQEEEAAKDIQAIQRGRQSRAVAAAAAEEAGEAPAAAQAPVALTQGEEQKSEYTLEVMPVGLSAETKIIRVTASSLHEMKEFLVSNLALEQSAENIVMVAQMVVAFTDNKVQYERRVIHSLDGMPLKMKVEMWLKEDTAINVKGAAQPVAAAEEEAAEEEAAARVAAEEEAAAAAATRVAEEAAAAARVAAEAAEAAAARVAEEAAVPAAAEAVEVTGVEATLPALPTLPPGWITKAHGGRVYYHNESTGESTLRLPSVEEVIEEGEAGGAEPAGASAPAAVPAVPAAAQPVAAAEEEAAARVAAEEEAAAAAATRVAEEEEALEQERLAAEAARLAAEPAARVAEEQERLAAEGAAALAKVAKQQTLTQTADMINAEEEALALEEAPAPVAAAAQPLEVIGSNCGDLQDQLSRLNRMIDGLKRHNMELARAASAKGGNAAEVVRLQQDIYRNNRQLAACEEEKIRLKGRLEKLMKELYCSILTKVRIAKMVAPPSADGGHKNSYRVAPATLREIGLNGIIVGYFTLLIAILTIPDMTPGNQFSSLLDDEEIQAIMVAEELVDATTTPAQLRDRVLGLPDDNEIKVVRDMIKTFILQ